MDQSHSFIQAVDLEDHYLVSTAAAELFESLRIFSPSDPKVDEPGLFMPHIYSLRKFFYAYDDNHKDAIRQMREDASFFLMAPIFSLLSG